jgi:hypothetical protein
LVFFLAASYQNYVAEVNEESGGLAHRKDGVFEMDDGVGQEPGGAGDTEKPEGGGYHAPFGPFAGDPLDPEASHKASLKDEPKHRPTGKLEAQERVLGF